MKKILLASLTVVAFASSSALAADMAVKPYYKAPPPAPVYSWTGCYLGAGGGYSMYNVEGYRVDGAGVFGAQDGTSGGRGWLGQAQVGCDYQFALGNLGQWVVGAFADGDWGSVKGNHNFPSIGADNFGQLKETSAWSAGGRIGYLVTPTLLAYESGGYTSARFGQVNGASVITGLPTFNESAQRYNGWFLGSGIEYAFTWLPIQGLFLKTEYRFSQYQTRNVPVFSAATGAAAGFDVLKPYTQTVTTELVYRFNWH